MNKAEEIMSAEVISQSPVVSTICQLLDHKDPDGMKDGRDNHMTESK